MSFSCNIEGGTKGVASFSECKKYRYMLSRKWGGGMFESADMVNFVLLNPSTADQNQDDPTIRRCIGYAKAWGFGGLYITNIFALRSTDPKVLYNAEDPVGPDNDAHLKYWPTECKLVVCGWGRHGEFKERGEAVRKILPVTHRVAIKALDSMTPAHPLYLSKSLQPVSF